MSGGRTGNPKIWLVRHGLSVFNYWSRTYGHRAAEFGNVNAVEADPDYKYLMTIKDKADTRLADPDLHKKGMAQAQKAQEKINQMNVRYVFVSPLKRTLDTCKGIFGSYPKKGQLIIKVNPLVRELMGSPCDVPVDTLTKRRAEYEPLGYDFSQLEKYDKKDLYFLYSLNSPEREQLFEEIAKEPDKPYIEVIAKYMKRFRKEQKKGNRKVESFVNARERAVEFAQFLLNFIPTAGLGENDDIVVVTHSLFISYCIATYWTPDGKLSVGNIPHTEPIAFDYHWILTLKDEFSSRHLLVMAVLALIPAQKKQVQQGQVAKCSKGHKLFFARQGNGVCICNKCRKPAEKAKGRWHCLFCNEDICTGCSSLPVPDSGKCDKLCLYGHPIKVVAHHYPWNIFRCMQCGRNLPTADKRWNCSFCTYDVCLNCKPST